MNVESTLLEEYDILSLVKSLMYTGRQMWI